MNGKISLGLLLHFAGLPQAWAEEDREEIPFLTEKKLTKALNVMADSVRGGIVYLTGDAGHVTDLLLNKNVPLSDIKGINFTTYFQNKFGKENVTSSLVAKKYTFLYNVGVEEALKKDYPAQLLKSIIKNVTDQNCWVFIVGEMSKTDFEQAYGITIEHSLRLPKKPQVELF